MLTCLLKDRKEQSNKVTVEKFSDRVWLQKEGGATVLRHLAIKNDGPADLSRLYMIIPRQAADIKVTDFSRTFFDERFYWNNRTKGEYKILEKDRGVVRFDDLEGIVLELDGTVVIQDLVASSASVELKLKRMLRSGERGFLRLVLNINRVVKTIGEYPTYGFQLKYLHDSRELAVVSPTDREVKFWSILDEETLLGGFDLHVFAPPNMRLEPSTEVSVDKAIENYSYDGKEIDYCEKARARMRREVGKKLVGIGNKLTISGTYYEPIKPRAIKILKIESFIAIIIALAALIIGIIQFTK